MIERVRAHFENITIKISRVYVVEIIDAKHFQWLPLNDRFCKLNFKDVLDYITGVFHFIYLVMNASKTDLFH